MRGGSRRSADPVARRRSARHSTAKNASSAAGVNQSARGPRWARTSTASAPAAGRRPARSRAAGPRTAGRGPSGSRSPRGQRRRDRARRACRASASRGPPGRRTRRGPPGSCAPRRRAAPIRQHGPGARANCALLRSTGRSSSADARRRRRSPRTTPRDSKRASKPPSSSSSPAHPSVVADQPVGEPQGAAIEGAGRARRRGAAWPGRPRSSTSASGPGFRMRRRHDASANRTMVPGREQRRAFGGPGPRAPHPSTR